MNIENESIYDAEDWAGWISVSLPTFANPDKDFDYAHKTITEWVEIIIDAVRIKDKEK